MENTALLRAIIENAIDGLITIDDSGIIESINPSACRLFHYKEEDVIGQNISILMPDPDKTRHAGYLHQYKKTSVASIIGIGRELTGMKKTGDQFPFRLGVSEVKYSGRTIYAGFIHDLSREKEAESKLLEYAAQLEEQVEERTQSLRQSLSTLQKTQDDLNLSLSKEKELGQLKSRFVSIASHEFRTPLSMVQLSVSLIERYASSLESPDITRHVGKIKKAVLNITAILNDFLSLEKLDSGKLEPKMNVFNLSELGREISDEMQAVLKGNQKIIFKHHGKRDTVRLDQNLLKNCMVILIDNAIKYSGSDSNIWFYTRINDSNCTIRICDNGIGIPETDQKHLFAAFFRAHNAGTISGTGLGLSILSRYTGLMNGKIDFRSKISKGTLFTLTFPQSNQNE